MFIETNSSFQKAKVCGASDIHASPCSDARCNPSATAFASAGGIAVSGAIGARFSLDEAMDFGEDTGTPVVEDYADKIPFKFTGKLDEFVIHLGESDVRALMKKNSKEPTSALRHFANKLLLGRLSGRPSLDEASWTQ